ncbi:hypothetical protein A7J67_08445 [Achromobacter xylosoxidans]|nr:hypothetical protein A7J67_08445 [Achromobacter xylosoxidans]
MDTAHGFDMEKKSPLEMTHELLLEMARSRSLWLHFPEDKPIDSSVVTWHTSYMKDMISSVFRAYRDAQQTLHSDALMAESRSVLAKAEAASMARNTSK